MVQTDASGSGLGAVLAQVQDGKERVIAYASRTLTSSEARYPVHKLEFRALNFAVSHKFRDYLYGHKITAVTDNKPLTYVLKKAKLDASGQRWVNDLAVFDLDILYRSGKSNSNADLSQIPKAEVTRILDASDQKTGAVAEETPTPIVQAVSNAVTFPTVVSPSMSPKKDPSGDTGAEMSSNISDRGTRSAREPSLEEAQCNDATTRRVSTSGDVSGCGTSCVRGPSLEEAQHDDAAIRRVIDLKCHSPAKPSRRQVSKESRAVQRLVRAWDRLSMKSGMLFYRRECDDGRVRHLPVLPRNMRPKVLHHLHDTIDHLGFDRALHLVRDRYYWPGLYSQTKSYIKMCSS